LISILVNSTSWLIGYLLVPYNRYLRHPGDPFISSKTLSSTSNPTIGNHGTLAHSKLTSLISEDKASTEKDKESGGTTGSGGSESPKSAGGSESRLDALEKPRFDTSIMPDLPNGRPFKSEMTNGGTWNAANSPWKGALSVPTRDGKSRARSRDYLKQ
jgi:hypothetical protein